MANGPPLGPNVTRWDQDQPTVWNNFFRNASDVFGVPTNKVMPFDADIVAGDEAAEAIGLNLSGTLGATRYLGEESSPIGISDIGVLRSQEGKGNTAEHEYMHILGNYFGSYPDENFGGSNAFTKWAHDQSLATDPDYYQWYYGHYPDEHTPTDRWLADPELYESELASHITGYGGQSGDYERQMMQDSWEKRGPRNQWSMDDSKRFDPIRQAGDPVDDFALYMNKDAYVKNNAQENALINAFNNNPLNDRLGKAKELIAPMIAQALTDTEYQFSNTLADDSVPTTEYGPAWINPFEPPHPSNNFGRPYDEPYYIGYNSGADYPGSYKESIEERFARLGAQYMKREEYDEFLYNSQIETDFREGMNFLLDRENNTTSNSGFKPDKGLVLTPPTVWEPNPIAGGF